MKPFKAGKMLAIIAVSIALGIPSAAFGDKEVKDPTPATVKDQTPVNAATVNGKSIAYAEFQREVQLFAKRMQSQNRPVPQSAAQVNKEVIDDLIMRELIFQESVKKGIKVDAQIIKEEVSAIQLRFADQQQFEGWLASMNMSEEKLKEQVSKHQAIRMLIEQEITPHVKISEDDSKAFYKNNPNLFQRVQEVHAQHILLKTEKDMTEKQKADARKKLLELKKRIDNGQDFGEIAKSNSQCPSASNNGDLGFFAKGQMVPAFEKTAFELKPGQVSDIVETQFGYHLIKVLERREPHTVGYEEVQPRIAASLRNREIQTEVLKYAEKLRKSAKIEMFIQ